MTWSDDILVIRVSSNWNHLWSASYLTYAVSIGPSQNFAIRIKSEDLTVTTVETAVMVLEND